MTVKVSSMPNPLYLASKALTFKIHVPLSDFPFLITFIDACEPAPNIARTGKPFLYIPPEICDAPGAETLKVSPSLNPLPIGVLIQLQVIFINSKKNR